MIEEEELDPDRPRKPIYFNKPQKRLILRRPKNSVSNWPRGAGKSTIIAWLIRRAALSMPRGVGTITGCTYEQILTKTIPSTIAQLENMGMIQDKHFWIGKRPPAKYKIDLPRHRPQKYDHFFSLYTGFGFHLVSQDHAASPRGLNTDLHITDESLLLDIDKYNVEVLGTNRGNDEHYGKVDIHHGVFHFTSMPLNSEGNWILKRSEYYDRDGHDFSMIKNMIIKLQLAFLKNKEDNVRMEIYREIMELDKKFRFYIDPESRKAESHYKDFLYSEAHAFDNLKNVSIGYLERQQRELTPLMFLIEMLGMRIKKVDGGFYPTFDRNKHGYKGHYNYSLLDSFGFDFAKIKNVKSEKDKDCDPNEPLYISVDFGAKINFMVIAQILTGKRDQVNFINNLYAKHPDILDDVFKKFVEYYKSHKKKLVRFYYDRNGNARLANSKLTFAEQGAKILREAGWTVEVKSSGSNPFHNDKYLLMGRIFRQAHLSESQQDPRFPIVKFNLIQCPETVISIEQAKIKQTTEEIKKDKSGELKDTVDQEEETHASDCVDNILFPRYKHLIDTNTRYMTPTMR